MKARILTIARRHYLPIAAAASGAVSGAVLNGWVWWPLIFLCVAVLLECVRHCATWRNAAMVGLCFGAGKLAVVLSWGVAVYPIAWLGDFSATAAIVLIGFYWILAALSIGVATAVAAVCIWNIPLRWWYAPAVALVLTASESLGAFFYSAVFAGPGSALQPYFSFGFVGYAGVNSLQLLALAQYGGVYVLSVIVYGVSALLWLGYTTKNTSWFVLMSFVGAGLLLAPQPRVDIAGSALIVDTDISATLLQEGEGYAFKDRAIRTAVTRALQEPDQHIVLPEDSRFVGQFTSPRLAQMWWSKRTNSTERWLYDSARTDEGGPGVVVRGYVLGSTASTTGPYAFDKSYLVPQGEFLPYFAWPILQLQPSPTQARIRDHLSYYPSTHTQYPSTSAMASYLFCFEAVNPFGVRQALERHPSDFIVHTVSHAWFTSSPTSLQHQLQAMLQVQAVWNRVPVVAAGNNINGFLVTATGNVVRGEALAQGTGWSLARVEW